MSSKRARPAPRGVRPVVILVVLSATALFATAGLSGGSVRGQTATPPAGSSPRTPPPPPPTERIDVEQAVSFPYDI